jgi:hypothetical protein
MGEQDIHTADMGQAPDILHQEMAGKYSATMAKQ